MKIKLIHYPYDEHQVGEILDLGDELNKSLISFGRAVWAEPTRKNLKEVIKETVEAVIQPHAPKKKLITNSLREKVQEAKKANATATKKRKDDDDI